MYLMLETQEFYFVRNFGKKSLTELDELLTSLNLKFGMDVSIYKLDKD